MNTPATVPKIVWIFFVGLALAPCRVRGAPQAAALQSSSFNFGTIGISVALWLGLVAGVVFAQADLASGFHTPPPAARPHTYWFWMGGNVTKEGITADLEAMQRVGVGGVLIHNIKSSLRVFSADYMSPEWFACLKHAVAEADRLGLKVAMHNRAGWTGSGGPWIKPEYAMQTLVWSETKVKGPQRFDGPLPQPVTRQGYYRDVAVQAVRTPSAELAGQPPLRIKDLDRKTITTTGPHASSAGGEPTPDNADPARVIRTNDIMDLTSRMDAQGRLVCELPEGEWTVLRFGHTVTEGASFQPSCPPEKAGLECDKLSRAGLDRHWAGGIVPILEAVGRHVGGSFVGLEVDSYEAGAQNWTAEFPAEFERRRGYAIRPWMAAYAGRVIGSVAETERVLRDARRTVEELYAVNYYGYFSERCRAVGLQFMAEAYGGPFDPIVCGGRADLPMGEFWAHNIWSDSCKDAASAAHQYGRPVVGAEAYTAHRFGNWCNDPYALKPLGDEMFTKGVNRFYFHTYAHNPWVDGRKPGMTMGPYGVQFNRGNTWWDLSGPWLTYLARCQYMLQQGSFVADVCVLPGVDTSQWKRAGYDFDWTAEEIVAQLKVVDGRLVSPGGTSYRMLQWPMKRPLRPELGEKIRALCRAGGRVNGLPWDEKGNGFVGPPLVGVPPRFEDGASQATALQRKPELLTVSKLSSHEPGRAAATRPPEPVALIARDLPDHVQPIMRPFTCPEKPALEALGLPPDFEVRSPGATILNWIHRRTAEAEFYFVANPSRQPVTADCIFRVGGRTPELWYPETGRIEDALVWSQEKDGRTVVPIPFGPADSVFVVFRRPVVNAGKAERLDPVKNAVVPDCDFRIEKAVWRPVAGVEAADPLKDITEFARARATASGLKLSVRDLESNKLSAACYLHVEYSVNGRRYRDLLCPWEPVELPAADTVVEGATSAFPGFVGQASRRKEGACGKGVCGEADTGSPAVAGEACPTPCLSTRCQNSEMLPGATVLELAGPWTVQFDPKWAGPSRPVVFESLDDWTARPEKGIRYFSGTAVYNKVFDADVSRLTSHVSRLYLDLGRVKNLAEVKLNGRDLGVLWKPPFRVDVTDYVKPGTNTLEVKVTNLWPNRLIGDAGLPATNRVAVTTYNPYRKDAQLLESGLIGPVRLMRGNPYDR